MTPPGGATEAQAAAELAKFLTTPDRYGGRSPLEAVVQDKIKGIAREIAEEVIGANTELRKLIQDRINGLVAQALADDKFLNEALSRAVAGALAKHREDDYT